MREVVIVSGARTAIGTFGGTLKEIPAQQLGAVAVKEAVRRVGIGGQQVDQVIMGNIIQNIHESSNVSREICLQAGLPVEVPTYTLNRLCGSGLQAVNSAAQAIISGDGEVIVAGGAESMSNAPYLLNNARFGYRMGHGEVVDGLLSALTDSTYRIHMGITAENLAEKYGISREEQDQFALESQEKAAVALREKRFAEQIVAVEIPRKKGEPLLFATDEHPRGETTLDKLAQLKPAFKKDGTVTAGNASGMNDAGAALVLMSAEKAAELGIEPLAKIKSWATAALDPRYMGYGPVPATQKALQRAGLRLDDIDLIEANEAFAAQCLAVERGLQWDRSRVNVNGGAIALGHPLGATGAIILIKLIYEMKRRDARYGLATLCIGGGQGIATIIER